MTIVSWTALESKRRPRYSGDQFGFFDSRTHADTYLGVHEMIVFDIYIYIFFFLTITRLRNHNLPRFVQSAAHELALVETGRISSLGDVHGQKHRLLFSFEQRLLISLEPINSYFFCRRRGRYASSHLCEDGHVKEHLIYLYDDFDLESFARRVLVLHDPVSSCVNRRVK